MHVATARALCALLTGVAAVAMVAVAMPRQPVVPASQPRPSAQSEQPNYHEVRADPAPVPPQSGRINWQRSFRLPSEFEELSEDDEEGDGHRPDSPDEAMRWRLLAMRDAQGQIADNALMNAVVQARQLLPTPTPEGHRADAAAGIGSSSWVSLGPGGLGGRVRSLVIHPTNPNVMWLGSVGGGIWKSSDGGLTWHPCDDFMANLAVASLALDPTNPDVLYAGTGEGFSNYDMLQGAGIFKSSDGGATWAQLGATANSNFNYVTRLAISPANHLVVLATTSTGLWRTTNGGATWAKVSTNTAMKDVDFHPSDGNKAIAGGGYGQALYSVDGGGSWSQASGLPALSWQGRVEVAYAPSSPNIVYASVAGNYGEIWKSTDGGASYSLVNTGNGFLSVQGWYDNAIWVDPTNANKLFVGGVSVWRSTDGGATLSNVGTGHSDVHAIVSPAQFDGAGNVRLFFANDGGIYRADNAYAEPGLSYLSLNNQLTITQFYGGGGSPNTGMIVGGAQDNGTSMFIGDPSAWQLVAGGDGGFAEVDPLDPNYFYGEYQWLNVFRSRNGGQFVEYMLDGLDDAFTACANFVAPLKLDPGNANVLLAGGCSLWRTTNAKSESPTWQAIKPHYLGSGSVPIRISAIAIAPTDSNVIWVGHNDGAVFKTTSGTAPSPTWTRVDETSPWLPNRFITSIAIDPANVNVALVTLGGFFGDNIWRTANGGIGWADVTGSGATGLPSAPARAVAIHPTQPSWLYAGTDVGVFVSEDSGATWTSPQNGPANAAVFQLFWMGTHLVAVTHGRGLFSTATSADSTPPTSTVDVLPPMATAPLTLSLAGDDDSGSVSCIGVQVRAGSAGMWLPWQTCASGGSTAFTGTLGQTYYFRARAKDDVGNWEMVSDFDAVTTLGNLRLTFVPNTVREASTEW